MHEEPRALICNFLNDNHIDYEVHDHQPILTVEEGQKIAESIGSMCCKSLLVKGKKQFFLFVLESHKRFNSKEASSFLGTGHLSFASREDLQHLMNTFPGAVSLLGLIFDKERKIELIIDQDVLKADYIDCHPNCNDCSLKISQESLKKILSSLQRSYRVIETR